MARVTITRREAERGLLPPVCALTGAPTEDVKRKAFLWQPPWIGVLILAGLLPYLIVSMMMRKTMTVDLPLVREKHGHWVWRALVGTGGVLLGIAVIIAGAVVGAADENARGASPLGGILFVVGLLGFLAALVAWIVLSSTSIRPSEITDDEITLVGVHQDFVDALEDERDRDEEEYRKRRDDERDRRRGRDDRRRPSRDEDDDDRPRRARRDDDD